MQMWYGAFYNLSMLNFVLFEFCGLLSVLKWKVYNEKPTTKTRFKSQIFFAMDVEGEMLLVEM